MYFTDNLNVDIYDFKNGRSLYMRNKTLKEFLEDPIVYFDSGEVIVGIDQSKRGFAAAVLSVYGNFLYAIRIHGEQAQTEEVIENLEPILWHLLEGVKERIVSSKQEKTILAKAYNVQESLGHVRAESLRVMKGIYPEHGEMNQHVWKSGVLPSSLRKKTVKKGSVAFINNELGTNISDDNVTDAMCIALQQLKQYNDTNSGISLEVTHSDTLRYNYLLIQQDETVAARMTKCRYDPREDLVSNVNAYGALRKPVYIEISVDELSLKEIAMSNVFIRNENGSLLKLALVLGMEE